jgi:drug/metabolite transporter (DMT)-like permease
MLQRIPPGARFMLLSAFAFSVMSVLVKWAGQRLPSQEIVVARAAVSLVLSWLMLRRAGVDLWGHARGWLLLRGVFGFLGLSCVFYSLTHLPIAEATVIQN